MRKFLATAAFALLATLALSACDQKKEEAAESTEQKVETVALPAPGSEVSAWKKYLASVVMQNMAGVKTTRPFMYFVPAGDDDKAQSDRSNQLDKVSSDVSRGVLPGNMLAFGGPDSKLTADLVVEAFKNAQAASMKDVVVLFVGAADDSERVKAAVEPAGASFRFVEMK